MKKGVIVVGLGFGDEGKGATVDLVAQRHNPKWGVKHGGAQALHNVLPHGSRFTGKRFSFSQLSAASFRGAATYLAPDFIFDPRALRRESEAFSRIMHGRPTVLVSEQALVLTRYHRAVNRISQMLATAVSAPSPPHACGDWSKDTCGRGIGVCRQYWLQYGMDAITARDLRTPGNQRLMDKLELLRARLIEYLPEFLSLRGRAGYEAFGVRPFRRSGADLFGSDDKARSFDILCADLTLSPAVVAKELTDTFEFWDRTYGLEPSDLGDVTVFESSQGILLDQTFGFPPDNTWSSTTPAPAMDLIRSWGGLDVNAIGVTRMLPTRHGAGPLPTYDVELTKRLVVSENAGNPENPWQGAVRHGWFDWRLFMYALEVSGVNSIVLTHRDQFSVQPEQLVCRDWEQGSIGDFCSVGRLTSRAAQQRRAEELMQATPIFEKTTPDGLVDLVDAAMPVAAVGNSPSAETWYVRKELV